jgi:hypothetical protein
LRAPHLGYRDEVLWFTYSHRLSLFVFPIYYEFTLRRLFQNHIVRTKFDIYIFITLATHDIYICIALATHDIYIFITLATHDIYIFNTLATHDIYIFITLATHDIYIFITLATHGLVWIGCGFWKNMLKYIQSRSIFSCNSIKKWFLYLLHNCSPLNTKKKID